MNRPKILILIATLCLSSCIGKEFESDQIINNYYLTTTDHYQNDIYIDYKLESGDFVGVVSATVNSYGYNESYIIARQSPVGSKFKLDLKTSNYYIVDITKKKVIPDDVVYGPYNIQDFELKKIQLGISDMKFNTNLK